MKAYLSEIFLAISGICLLLVFSPSMSSIVSTEFPLLESMVSDIKEIPRYFIFSSFVPSLLIVIIFGLLIIRRLGLITSSRYANYCYAISGFTLITLLIGYIRFETLFWIAIALPTMLLASYFAKQNLRNLV